MLLHRLGRTTRAASGIARANVYANNGAGAGSAGSSEICPYPGRGDSPAVAAAGAGIARYRMRFISHRPRVTVSRTRPQVRLKNS